MTSRASPDYVRASPGLRPGLFILKPFGLVGEASFALHNGFKYRVSNTERISDTGSNLHSCLAETRAGLRK